jgi:hypothetical protein
MAERFDPNYEEKIIKKQAADQEKTRQKDFELIFPPSSEDKMEMAMKIEAAVKEARAKGYKKGVKVARVNNPYKYEEGEIVAFNESPGGQFPGDTHPIAVVFPSTGDKVLKFGVDELKIINPDETS